MTVPPPDPIARLRELAKHERREAGFADNEWPESDKTGELAGEGGRRTAAFLDDTADALTRLQAEKDQLKEYMESARVGYDAEKEARQKAMARAEFAEMKWNDLPARVDRLTAELKELRDAVTSTLTEPHAVVALARAHRQDSETADELEVKVDRLTAALREIAYGGFDGVWCHLKAKAALAHADPASSPPADDRLLQIAAITNGYFNGPQIEISITPDALRAFEALQAIADTLGPLMDAPADQEPKI